jgi:toxin ParE1/3/4
VTIFWTPEALADRHSIYDYIEADNPNAAISLDERFSVAASRLSGHPYLGRPGRISGTREMVAHQNYILVYDMAEAGIRVLRVLHVARQWPTSGQ